MNLENKQQHINLEIQINLIHKSLKMRIHTYSSMVQSLITVNTVNLSICPGSPDPLSPVDPRHPEVAADNMDMEEMEAQ